MKYLRSYKIFEAYDEEMEYTVMDIFQGLVDEYDLKEYENFEDNGNLKDIFYEVYSNNSKYDGTHRFYLQRIVKCGPSKNDFTFFIERTGYDFIEKFKMIENEIKLIMGQLKNLGCESVLESDGDKKSFLRMNIIYPK